MKESFIRKYSAVSALLIVLLMTVLDVTIVNVALPGFAAEFNVSDAASVWVVSAYQLIITMTLLPLASLGDIYSYRKVLITGIAAFTTSSLGCALADSFPMLLAMRVAQGLGGACIMGVNIALTRCIYSPSDLPKGLALNAMVIAVATAAGPSLAGIILSISTWRWLFLINVPFGIVAFILAVRLLPGNTRPEGMKFDPVGALQNMLVFGLIFIVLGNAADGGNELLMACLFVVAVAAAFLYIRRQLHHSYPLFPVDLFRSKLYSLCILTNTSAFIAQNAASIVLPFMFLKNLGYSELTAGLLMTPWPLATAVMAPVAARYVGRFNPGKIAAFGMGVFCTGLLSLLCVTFFHTTPADIAWRMLLCGIGFGMYQTPNNVVMVSATPVERTGAAGGMQSTARLTGQTFGATVVTFIFSLSASGIWGVRCVIIFAAVFAAAASIFSVSRKNILRVAP
ncbi:MAG: MFS transporter [Candidatus Amulumruptor caecigallinarius]|nr:MFS transporter [Candidatus Amulumruptor caecigallinarius]